MLQTAVKGLEIITATARLLGGGNPWENKALGGGKAKLEAGLCKICEEQCFAFS